MNCFVRQVVRWKIYTGDVYVGDLYVGDLYVHPLETPWDPLGTPWDPLGIPWDPLGTPCRGGDSHPRGGKRGERGGFRWLGGKMPQKTTFPPISVFWGGKSIKSMAIPCFTPFGRQRGALGGPRRARPRKQQLN